MKPIKQTEELGILELTSEETDELDSLIDYTLDCFKASEVGESHSIYLKGLDKTILVGVHQKVMDLMDKLHPKKSVDIFI
tara:strand:+ start:417 stop:656 length:240 start_codon:yes stop_codon:yes gene_type:complete